MCIVEVFPTGAPLAACAVSVDAPIPLQAWTWLASQRELFLQLANVDPDVKRSLVPGAHLAATEHGLCLRFRMSGLDLRDTQMKLRRFERCVARWRAAAPALLQNVMLRMPLLAA